MAQDADPIGPKEEPDRRSLKTARRIVLKLGTRVLTHDDGRLALARLFSMVEAAATIRSGGREILLVSSGAVGLGRDVLELEETPEDLALRQACAAVGQTRLMALYQDGFSQYGLTCAQVLLTEGDLDDRARYLNLRRTLATLLECGVVPIINENDAVSTAEIELSSGSGSRPVFGDNDRLSALVAAKLHADLLILLTDVEGCYDRDPRLYSDARLIPRADDPKILEKAVSGKTSEAGRGGMKSKVEAAAIASRGGCHVVIASGRRPDVLETILAGEEIGTWVPERGRLKASHRWIAFAAAPRGILHLDAGAVEALRMRRASLLAAGVEKVEGKFRSGDVVELRGPSGDLVGRGRIPWDSKTVRKWCAGSPPLEVRNAHCLIRRNHFVLEV